MSKQHECEWYMCANPAGEIYAMCRDIRCHGKVLKRDEIEARLNEYETLRRATILLDKEGARLIATDIEQNSDLTRRYVAVLRGYADIVE